MHLQPPLFCLMLVAVCQVATSGKLDDADVVHKTINSKTRIVNVTVFLFDSTNCSFSEQLARNATQTAISSAQLPPEIIINFDFAAPNDGLQAWELLLFDQITRNESVDAVVGAVGHVVCETAVTLAERRRKPFVSWGCSGLPSSRGGSHSPRVFYRIIPPASATTQALVALIKHFKWKNSAVVTIDEGHWLALANQVDVALRDHNCIVRNFIVLHRTKDLRQMHENVHDKVAAINPVVKAVILFMDMASSDLKRVMQAAEELDMTNGRCAFFTLHVSHVLHPTAWPNVSHERALRTLFVLTHVPPDTTYAETWSSDDRSINISKMHSLSAFHRVHDSTAVLLSVIRSALTLNISQRPLVPRTRELQTGGLLGPIRTTATGVPEVLFTLLGFDVSRRSYRAIIYLRENGSAEDGERVSGGEESVSLPPPDPPCILDEFECESDVSPVVESTVAVVAVCSVTFVIGTIFVSLFARRHIQRSKLTKGPFGILIFPGELLFVSPRCINSAGTGKYPSDFPGQEKPDLLKGSHDSLRFATNSLASSQPDFDDRITRARYKGDMVLVKYLPIRSIELRNKALKELKMMHDLRNENVNAFHGLFINPEKPALIFENCTRGSLEDIIQSEDIKLDWSFKLSLLTDLVRGMKYLHGSAVRVHGRLTSRNCVIDSRWVLKVTDYGLPLLNAAQGLPPAKQTCRELLWTAPELLRNEIAMSKGSQSGDVYSFSIVMQEVVVRGPPYCMLALSPEEIIEKVKHPPPMIRPSVSKQAAPPEAINIMRECWAEIPDMRPDFSIICEQFKRLNHGKKVNIVDTMFEMLEKYSNNLEEIIRDRTEQLAEEKKKTEQLLNRMLPSSVAELLKRGLPIVPETYEDVTIYFSDIVGFTTISAYSTAMEVIDLLNDLYTCFDATIDSYDVYKVETIGDAYMVAGGLPNRIEDHACQVASMALDLLHQSGRFKIRHLPNMPLKLRIGLHTGSCCAGVVGLTMPRYCLFGDTINTASRMESTGHALRIHISQATKDKLDEVGGYQIQTRGEIELKGKGKATTYWLLGKDGFDKELPCLLEDGLDEEMIKRERAFLQQLQQRQQSATSSTDATCAEMDLPSAASSPTAVTNSTNPQFMMPVNVSVSVNIEPSDSRRESGSSAVTSESTSGLCEPSRIRRTLSNASERRVAMSNSGSGGSGGVLEFMPHSNSYILSLNRAHSVDSGEPGDTVSCSVIPPSASSASTTLQLPWERPTTAPASVSPHNPPVSPGCSTGALLYPRRTSVGCLDNQQHSRRRSEAWTGGGGTLGDPSCGGGSSKYPNDVYRCSSPKIYPSNSSTDDRSNTNMFTLGATLGCVGGQGQVVDGRNCTDDGPLRPNGSPFRFPATIDVQDSEEYLESTQEDTVALESPL